MEYTDVAWGLACEIMWHLPISLQCVKALVYYDVQSCKLDIGNEKGDTPLHIAARWGYQGIIETLLQNGASTEIQNRMKETPLKCALNPKVDCFCVCMFLCFVFFLFVFLKDCDFEKKINVYRLGLGYAGQIALVPEGRTWPVLSLLHLGPDG